MQAAPLNYNFIAVSYN